MSLSTFNLQAALNQARLMGAPQTALLEAAAAGVIELAFICDTRCPLPSDLKRGSSRPAILVIGDDPPFDRAEAAGPNEWAMTKRLKYWEPRGALIHAAAGSESHYRETVLIASLVGRFLLVETGSARAAAWCDTIQRLCPTTCIAPRDGAHPIPETVH